MIETEYTVTVTNDGHGEAIADPEFGATGTKVILTAKLNEGYQFKEWKLVKANGGTISEIAADLSQITNDGYKSKDWSPVFIKDETHNSVTTSPALFIIGTGDAVIQAIFESSKREPESESESETESETESEPPSESESELESESETETELESETEPVVESESESETELESETEPVVESESESETELESETVPVIESESELESESESETETELDSETEPVVESESESETETELESETESKSETKYTVTVTNDGNGEAIADPESGVTGTKVSLTAKPNEGYQFKEWKLVTANGGTISEISADLGQIINGGYKSKDWSPVFGKDRTHDSVTTSPALFIIGTGDAVIQAVFES